jgi:hypothetical protein
VSKRFIDTGIFDDDWFMDLSKDAKLLWVYFITKCDHAGIIKLNEKLCKVQTDIKDLNLIIKQLGNRLVTVNEHLYFIPKFIDFQYPGFPNSKVRQQISAVEILTKYGLFKEGKLTLSKELVNSYEHDNDNDNDTVIDNVNDLELKNLFENFRQNYPGTKRGFEVEFENLKKKHKDWEFIIPILSDNLNYQKSSRELKRLAGGFVPEWKNLQTWINQKCWEEEIEINNISNGTNKQNNGASNEAIARIIAEKFGSDSTQRK